jgi:signal transduction histidine kinase
MSKCLPVIFISAIYSDEYHHRKGYDAGAVDFLSKPFVPEILLSKVRVFLDLYDQRIKLEKLVDQLNAKNEALEHEIKQRQQAEAALQKANNDKDKLFSIISHDLRSPFQPLLGNTQLLLHCLDDFSKAEVLSMITSVYNSAEAVFNLLENLLTWSRMQQGRIEYSPRPIDLHDLAERTVGLLTEVAQGKNIRLAHTVEPKLMIHADEYMIDTVMRNLTSNALKFTPDEGEVIISARPHQNGISSNNGGAELVEVLVTDTGVGISQADIDKLFKMDVHHSTQGTAHETGTGLGLIMCQDLVIKNGGQIWVESKEKKGTTVTFTVPAKECPQLEGE